MIDTYTPEQAKERVLQLLDRLSQLEDARATNAAERQSLIESLIPAEIKAQIDEINAEYGIKDTSITVFIEEAEEELKSAGVFLVESVKSDSGYQAVKNNGRVTYKAKELDIVARTPGNEWLADFRTESAPSVSIRRPKS